MSLGSSIFARATVSHAGLKAIIGTRCYPKQAPKDVKLPYMTYEVISSPLNNYTDHDGCSRWVYRVQLNGFGKNRDEASQVGDQMFDAFHGWNNGTAVGYSFVYNRFEADELQLNLHQEIVAIVVDHII